MKEKHCENCHYADPAGYRQVICRKKNRFEPELYSCEWWKEKKNDEVKKDK